MRKTDDHTDTASAILEAAEALFSAHGVRGVSLREIARAAGVAVSSVAYHYGDKSGVLQAIYDRHTQPMNARRMELLGEALRIPDPSDRVRAILRAYLLPALNLAADDAPAGGARFTRMRAVVSAEGDPVTRRVVAEICDPVTRKFVDALADALPCAPRGDVVWRAQFLLGSMYFTLTSPGRVDRLSDGQARGADLHEALRQLTDTFHDSLLALTRQSALA